MEGERQALAAFVKKFDSIGLGLGSALPMPHTKLHPPLPTPPAPACIAIPAIALRVKMAPKVIQMTPAIRTPVGNGTDRPSKDGSSAS